MPVNTPHPSYTAALPIWNRIDHCLDGPDAVKLQGTLYLPKITDWDEAKYSEYLSRAVFFNASGRTHEAMLGFLFRKPPTMDFTGMMEQIAADVDLAGNPMISYARQVAHAACGKGRAGTMVDYSADESRPYFAFYPAQSIVNWREKRVKGKMRLSLLVLRESGFVAAAGDPYSPSLQVRFREFFLDDDGFVECRVWETTEDVPSPTTPQTAVGTGTGMGTGSGFTLLETTQPTRGGKRLEFIPFVFHGADQPGPSIGKAPMADITAVNISQYHSSADLENGRHFCGIPTAYAIGFEGPGGDDGNEEGAGQTEKFYLGGNYAWSTPNLGASCGWLEFSGQGLKSLTDAIVEKSLQMAALGARLIEPKAPGSDAEAYETVALRASAETSTLARIGMLVSETISEACRIAEWWGSPGMTEYNQKTQFALNSDFTSAAIQPLMLQTLKELYHQGLMSKEVLWHNLQRGELYPEGWTFEEEWASIEANPPVMPGMGLVAPAKPPMPKAA